MTNFVEYIKTDKNGTKYYANWKCPRCGGMGRADKWCFTGYTCYACNGSGRRIKPLIVKEYTPEYQAKLDERRKAREAKKPIPSADELKRRADEARINTWKFEGFAADGTGYLHVGNTYANKITLHRNGGKWNPYFKGYVAPEKIDGLSGITIEEIHAQDFCNEYGYINMHKAIDYSIEKGRW